MNKPPHSHEKKMKPRHPFKIGESYMSVFQTKDLLAQASANTKREFEEKKFILSYEEYLEIFSKKPKQLIRNSAEYMLDMFQYFGIGETKSNYDQTQKVFHLFEKNRSKNKPTIIGQEEAHESIYRILEQFVRQGKIDKLILLHGPNGSSKSSTAEAISNAMEEYSKTDEGALYKFNWIFPTDKIGYEGLGDAKSNKKIGFGDLSHNKNGKNSFAHLEDEEILCKIVSEMKENPVFLLPQAERIAIYQNACKKFNQNQDVPIFIEEGSLSSKNKKIFDSLLVAYKGDLEKVLRHVQVERFFYSSRYRVGIACVEPQMAIDAQDKQITLEKNLQNIPPALQNIRLFEPQGELIDANRGLIEFSDLLKRPLETFKYLITTIEKMNINLASGITDLDLVMLASSNEKHLDAFKNTQDWPSFKGRFELIRVPYLLSVKLEQKIYQEDIKIIEKTKKIGPHALNFLSKWSILTRLRQPEVENYHSNLKGIIEKLSPFDKMNLYDGEELSQDFNDQEISILKRHVSDIKKESHSSIAYEGRFGASPREIKMILYFASQNTKYDSVSALAIFDEIEKMTRDITVYDFLQFEPRNGYHDFNEFIKYIKLQYAFNFQKEFLNALNLYDEQQYVKALQKYMKHVTVYLQNDKIQNEITGKQENANEDIMEEIENLMGIKENRKEYREKLISKIASWKLENKNSELNFSKVFENELNLISKKIYENKENDIKKIKNCMMMYDSEDYSKQTREILDLCENTFKNLEEKFGYTRRNTWQSLIFLNS
jgi:serine protein kinase